MKIIVGLGNPGDEYNGTRHNIGFDVIDTLKDELKFENDFAIKKKFNAHVVESDYKDEKILLVKPLTFMNLSGESIRSILDFYKADLDDIWIIHDDLDFQLGTFKFSINGSGGSHNGVISVISNLKSDEFTRLRIGIENRDAEFKKKFVSKDYVLSRFTKNEEEIVSEVMKQAVDSLIYALENGVKEAMNKFN